MAVERRVPKPGSSPKPVEAATRIAPRNLTARLAFRVAGNPATTRPEDAVANCYPGLEIDIRNLDRRFFPGLVFDFIARNDTGSPYKYPNIYGAKLAYVDLEQDPDLQTDQGRKLYDALSDAAGALSEGNWYLDWIEQSGRRLYMNRQVDPATEAPMDGLFVWRLVRGLEPGALKIGLKRRTTETDIDANVHTIELSGWRRAYLDPKTGVINGAYQPGEMLQSLCSPWQHDFRDCYCHYWASNHPDVVYGEIYPGEPTLPSGAAWDPQRANIRLDWLRADRSRPMAAGALNSFLKNRPYQYDHFQINRTWQDLNVVIADTEIGASYVPEQIDAANPLSSPAELAKELRENLAGLELALICEYLYARFSLLSAEQAARATQWPKLAEHVTFARHYLMLVAASEMQHLRWANELLWILYDHGLVPSYDPVLVPVKCIPDGKGGFRPRRLRRLEADALGDFIAVEHPSGFIDGAYARVVSTLRDTKTYPAHMIEIAERIANDGTQHFSRFMDIKAVLSFYRNAAPPYPYLRDVKLGTVAETAQAGDKLKDIMTHLKKAYVDGAHGDYANSGRDVVDARAAMNDLLDLGESLAADRGLGIPFFDFLDPAQ